MRDLSLAAACKKADLRYSTLHAQIHNRREIPFSTIDRLATALALPISHFSQNAAPFTFEPVDLFNDEQIETARIMSDLVLKQTRPTKRSRQINIDDMLDWLMANNSQLVNCKELIDWFNLFLPIKPGDTAPTPYRIGPKSLSAKFFSILSVESYNEIIQCYDEDTRRAIVQAHLDCADKPYLITDRKVDTVSKGIRVKGTYRRLLAPVTDTDGRKLTLSFSKLTHFPRA
ncbi:hypothetical protein N4R57_00060 [Rhodobacteraceae bacterium D3-12]|nr:hypothetical protein N4R57_00060 [Rhodobacteraceae bacterium D3-12]